MNTYKLIGSLNMLMGLLNLLKISLLKFIWIHPSLLVSILTPVLLGVVNISLGYILLTTPSKRSFILGVIFSTLAVWSLTLRLGCPYLIVYLLPLAFAVLALFLLKKYHRKLSISLFSFTILITLLALRASILNC